VAPAKWPNLLFLFTDEQRADTLAAYGNRLIQTPNLDRLAARSTVFERAYVTQPVCTPSRSSIMTGLWPHTCRCTENNIPLPADLATIAEHLREGGYATGYFGKWHLGDEIFAQHGFQDWRSIEDGYHCFYRSDRDQAARSDYYRWLMDHGFEPKDGVRFGRGEAARLPEEFGKPAFLAREAARFIRDHKTQPWCLYVNWLEPHMPFYGPRDDQYDPAEVVLPANFDHPPAQDQPAKAHRIFERMRDKGFEGQALDAEPGWRQLIAKYWGLCSLVDTHAGTILSTLEACGLEDRTIVVYTSDHGDFMGSHRLVGKGLMFEEAARVPLLVRLPGQTAARRVARPVSQVDLVPTLLDLMDQPPAGLPGRTLRADLEGRPDAAPDDVFIEWNGEVHVAAWTDARTVTPPPEDAVRTVVTPDGWKLNWSARGEHELYNLNEDPIEVRNLARQRASWARMQDLAAEVRAWQARTGDTAALPAL
jgi:arylsulfatase A-like enzyme